jgi:uncharacterized membrane protein YjgN (DUF898 family)
MEPGAFGYAWRSLLWAGLAVLTLGLAYPYMHFAQARYMADRSRFGTLAMRQEGSWLGLLAQWIRLYLAGALMFLAFWGYAEETRMSAEGMRAWFALLVPLSAAVFFCLLMVYEVAAFRYLWDNRVIGGTRLENDLRVRSILFAYVRGSTATIVMTGFVGAIAGTAFVGIGYALSVEVLEAEAFLGGDLADALARTAASADVPPVPMLVALAPILAGLALSYLFVLAGWFAFGESLVTQPILRRKVEGMLLRNPDALARAGQARREEAREAGGFAEALGADMGAGFA